MMNKQTYSLLENYMLSCMEDSVQQLIFTIVYIGKLRHPTITEKVNLISCCNDYNLGEISSHCATGICIRIFTEKGR